MHGKASSPERDIVSPQSTLCGVERNPARRLITPDDGSIMHREWIDIPSRSARHRTEARSAVLRLNLPPLSPQHICNILRGPRWEGLVEAAGELLAVAVIKDCVANLAGDGGYAKRELNLHGG